MRILGNSLLLNFVVYLILALIILVPLVVWAVLVVTLFHGDKAAPFFIFGEGLFHSIFFSISLIANVIYMCTVYRVLADEKRGA